jgi:tRNA U54 and U55 pseudouridine synthase Pus10
MIDDLKIDIEKFNKVVKAIRKNNMKEVSFEFLVGSCFPKALENIKEEMRRQYTLGYVEGQKEGKE